MKQDSLVALLPMVRMLRAGVAQMPNLLEVFRDGGGVPWVHLGAEARESQTERNKSWFEQRLASAVA